MSVMSALLEALDRGLVVFKTESGLVVAADVPLDDVLLMLHGTEMVWDEDDVADARTLA